MVNSSGGRGGVEGLLEIKLTPPGCCCEELDPLGVDVEACTFFSGFPVPDLDSVCSTNDFWWFFNQIFFPFHKDMLSCFADKKKKKI